MNSLSKLTGRICSGIIRGTSTHWLTYARIYFHRYSFTAGSKERFLRVNFSKSPSTNHGTFDGGNSGGFNMNAPPRLSQAASAPILLLHETGMDMFNGQRKRLTTLVNSRSNMTNAFNKPQVVSNKPRYRLEIGAAGQAHPDKPEHVPDESSLKWLSFGAGEDSYFFGNYAMGVADGVSASTGAARYSRTLMDLVAREYLRTNHTSVISPTVALTTAFMNIDSSLPGSTTACVAAVFGDQLHVSNIGDSGLKVLHDDTISFSTQETSHYFNCPFQLGFHYDGPEDVVESCIELHANDLIIMASDGLFDNMYDEELGHLCRKAIREQTSMSRLAELLVEKAAYTAFGTPPAIVQSPFADNAARNGFRFAGGKPDDITVLVALVRPRNEHEK